MNDDDILYSNSTNSDGILYFYCRSVCSVHGKSMVHNFEITELVVLLLFIITTIIISKIIRSKLTSGHNKRTTPSTLNVLL